MGFNLAVKAEKIKNFKVQILKYKIKKIEQYINHFFGTGYLKIRTHILTFRVLISKLIRNT